MTAKESKAVAWLLFDRGVPWSACLDEAEANNKNIEFGPPEEIVPLVPESALHAAEAEMGVLRRRVVALADDWDARNRLDQSDAQWMREKTYEQCADELRLLASDGGADGDSDGS